MSIGLHSLNVATWKPSPKYVIEKLKYFFIGGSPELNDSYITGVSYCQITILLVIYYY